MRLDGLKNLYDDMKRQNIDRYRFNYTYGDGTFDMFFFIDEKPFTLLFGARGENFSFEIKVKKGFKIEVNFDNDIYYNLIGFLNLEYSPGKPFKPAWFFIDFNKHIPNTANIYNIPRPQQIIIYRNDIEEADKMYFLKWRDNTLRGEKVSEENLHKTKTILGYRAYEICKNKNLSSCWTDDISKEKTFILPR